MWHPFESVAISLPYPLPPSPAIAEPHTGVLRLRCLFNFGSYCVRYRAKLYGYFLSSPGHWDGKTNSKFIKNAFKTSQK